MPAKVRKRLKSAEAAGSADNLESTASGPTPPEDFTGELGDAAELRRLEQALAVGGLFIGHNQVVPFVETTKNLADFFTKPLEKKQFIALRNIIMNISEAESQHVAD